MINHTCLIPPTGVPVDVMTHCAEALDPPAGICNEAPSGQVVELAYDDGVPTKTLERLTPERANVPTAAATIAPVDIRRRFSFEICTGRASSMILENHTMVASNLRSAGYVIDDVVLRTPYFSVTRTRIATVPRNWFAVSDPPPRNPDPCETAPRGLHAPLPADAGLARALGQGVTEIADL
jgi:hypothetical protein